MMSVIDWSNIAENVRETHTNTHIHTNRGSHVNPLWVHTAYTHFTELHNAVHGLIEYAVAISLL